MHAGHFSSQQIVRCQRTVHTPDNHRRDRADENVADPTRSPDFCCRVKPWIIKFAADRAINNSTDCSTGRDKQNNLPDRHKTSALMIGRIVQGISNTKTVTTMCRSVSLGCDSTNLNCVSSVTPSNRTKFWCLRIVDSTWARTLLSSFCRLNSRMAVFVSRQVV